MKAKIRVLKNEIKVVLKDKKKLPVIVCTGLLFIFSITAMVYVVDGINKLYFDGNTESTVEELQSKLTLNIVSVFLFLGLTLLGILLIKGKTLMRTSESPKQIEIIKEMKEPVKTAKRYSMLYLVLLPLFYIIFLMTGVPMAYPNFTEVDILELQNIAFIPMFFLWAIMGSYIWKYKKITTAKEYFEKLNYEYIISERQITNKIRNISILLTIGFLAITLIFSSNAQNSEAPLAVWMMFSISFGMFSSAIFSYIKISDLEKKKRFKLFIASSFCKRCLTSNELQAKNLSTALKWYSDFFKKIDHRGIKRMDKIVMRILAADTRNSTLVDIIDYFESDDNYAAINKIAVIMGVTVDELFEDETLIQKIKGWLIPLGGLATIGSFVTTFFLLFK